MADADQLEYLAGELRKHAKNFSDAATTLHNQAQQLNWSAEAIASNSSSWAGSGSQAFQTSWQNYQSYTISSTNWLTGASDALNKLAQKLEDSVQQIRAAQAMQTATTLLTVGLVVVDVLQLGLDPVTDAATVGAAGADVAADGTAEAAALAVESIDSEVAGDLEGIVNEIVDTNELSDIPEAGGAPGDGLDFPDDSNWGDGGDPGAGGDPGGGDGSGDDPNSGGQPRGGQTSGSYDRYGSGDDPNRFGNPERGFGNLTDQEFNVTQENIDKITQHLSDPQFANEDGSMYGPNARMLERIQTAFNEGRPISGADASFYFHELYETDLMDQGLDYDAAHRAALDYYNVSDFTVYDGDVIAEFRDEFGRLWLQFWGL